MPPGEILLQQAQRFCGWGGRDAKSWIKVRSCLLPLGIGLTDAGHLSLQVWPLLNGAVDDLPRGIFESLRSSHFAERLHAYCRVGRRSHCSRQVAARDLFGA